MSLLIESINKEIKLIDPKKIYDSLNKILSFEVKIESGDQEQIIHIDPCYDQESKQLRHDNLMLVTKWLYSRCCDHMIRTIVHVSTCPMDAYDCDEIHDWYNFYMQILNCKTDCFTNNAQIIREETISSDDLKAEMDSIYNSEHTDIDGLGIASSVKAAQEKLKATGEWDDFAKCLFRKTDSVEVEL